MRWLLSAYTIRFNYRHKLQGHVFSGRYKALLVERSGNGDLKTVCDCVHLYPARARLLGSEDRLLGYPWSSVAWFLSAPDHRPRRMRVDPLLGEHGIVADGAAGREESERRMEARRRQETTLTVGWIAKRLSMGTRKSVVTRLQEVTRQSRE